MSPALEGNDLMKKRSCSTLPCNVPCSPGPGTSRSVSSVFCVCSIVLSWLLYHPDLSSEVLSLPVMGNVFPGLNESHFN